MALPQDSVNMALFCDFENIALGVRDTKFEKFDIKPVLEKLLLKGSIVVKKAYCDWDRYKTFKGAMHEASFELIEIPHVRQSGKNSADIRLVVDALDLCYTKSHVDTFVIISGDSDFSPLVSKLRENAKRVIGVGVKNSTSDLLVANCDEFIFYDDLARELQRAQAKRESRTTADPARRAADDKQRKPDADARKLEAITIAVETFDALASERSDSGKIWASVLKSAIKRRKPGFNETYYGFRAFGNLLDEAQAHGLLEIGRDEKSGTYVSRPAQAVAADPLFGADALKADEAPGVQGGEAPAAASDAQRHGGAQRNRDQRGDQRDGREPREAREHRDGRHNRAQQRDERRKDTAEPIPVDGSALAAEPAQATDAQAGQANRQGNAKRNDGERRNAKRDDGRHGKGRNARKPEQMPLIDDTHAEAAAEPETPAVVESTPVAPDEVPAAVATREVADTVEAADAHAEPAAQRAASKAKKTPARARKAAAKKVATTTDADADTSAPAAEAARPQAEAPAAEPAEPAEATASDEAAPAKAPAKRARSGAARAGRARRAAAAADTPDEA